MKWLLSLPIIRHLIQFLKSIPLSKNAYKGGGFENQGVYIVQYDNMEIKQVL